MSSFKPSGEPRISYSGKIVQLVNQEMIKGDINKVFERAERAPGVRLILVNSEGKICITQERRSEINDGQGGYDYRLPGGKVFDSLDEYNNFRKNGGDILKVAKEKAVQEGKEEVGAIFGTSKHIHTSECGATMRWDLLYFEICEFDLQNQQLEDGEDIEVMRFTPEEVKKSCLNGKIREDRSVAVLLRYIETA